MGEVLAYVLVMIVGLILWPAFLIAATIFLSVLLGLGIAIAAIHDLAMGVRSWIRGR